ncbi:MAG: monoterpene epsilon-lactone hydrolase [Myxococcota bacterium]
MLKSIGRTVLGIATISARRILRRAPLVVGWTFREELIIGLMRPRFARREPVEKSRAALDSMGDQVQGLADWEPVEVGSLTASWARPKSDTPDCGVTVLYLHGGGYGVGSVRSHRAMVERMVAVSGAAFLVLNYRLAPEHPCPAAIEDVAAAWAWLLAHGVEPKRAVIAGDSAGGGLVLSSLLAIRDGGGVLPALGFCISPWTDLTLSGVSHTDNHEFDYLGVADLPGFATRYAGALPLSDPRVSPAFADFSGLPPLVIQVGGAEVLLDDARMVAARAEADGVSVTLDIWPGQIHVWHGFARIFPAGQAAIEAMGARIVAVNEEAT